MIRSQRFGPLFWTQFLGAFNDNLLKNALVLSITFQGKSLYGIPPAQMVALAGGIFILPFFLFSARAGSLADQLEKSKLIRWIKLAEMGIMLMAAGFFWADNLSGLVLALFLMGVHSAFFGPLKYSILPQLLTPQEWAMGNGLIEAGTFLAILLGTLAGSLFYSSSSIGWIMLGIALLGWLFSLKIPLAPPVRENTARDESPVRSTLQILSLVRSHPGVFRAILGISWFWFFGAVVLTLLPTYAKDTLQLNSEGVTLFLALFSVGIGAGSLLCGHLCKPGRTRLWITVGSIGMGAFTADLYFAQPNATGPILRIYADFFMLAVAGGIFSVPLYLNLQSESPAPLRSRIIAGNNIVNALFMVVSAGVLMVSLEAGMTVSEHFLFLGIAQIAAGAALTARTL